MPVRYSQAASGTPNPQTVLEIDGLSFSASCDESGGSITANFAARSTEAATLHETVTVDSGPDPGNSGAADFSGNLQIDLPAGTTLQTGGPSATAGYTRVAVQGVYSAPTKTVDLNMFLTVNARPPDARSTASQCLPEHLRNTPSPARPCSRTSLCPPRRRLTVRHDTGRGQRVKPSAAIVARSGCLGHGLHGPVRFAPGPGSGGHTSVANLPVLAGPSISPGQASDRRPRSSAGASIPPENAAKALAHPLRATTLAKLAERL